MVETVRMLWLNDYGHPTNLESAVNEAIKRFEREEKAEAFETDIKFTVRYAQGLSFYSAQGHVHLRKNS